MSLVQNSIAVTPLCCRASYQAEETACLPDVVSVVQSIKPQEPLHCVRPAAISAASKTFVQAFPGEVLYAVKCNSEPAVLRAVWAGGVRHFDCASIAEVTLVRRLFPNAAIHFMHPVKSRAAICEAWALNGVRDFVFDTLCELDKIMAEVVGLKSMAFDTKPGLFVRLALPHTSAAIDLSTKFGADTDTAIELLRTARGHAGKLGLAFHVGSQCMDPLAWREAIKRAGFVIAQSGVDIDVLDIGGGFPVAYPEISPPPLSIFLAEITAAFGQLNLPNTRLWAEPGRALVAGGGSVVVQVQLRKANMLYVNDGVFGSLSDAGALGFRFPVRLIKAIAANKMAPLAAFGLYGPTCDSSDVMRGPFMLPDDVTEGDWIEIGQLGAYGSCLRTSFNGFDRASLQEVCDKPMLETAGYETKLGSVYPVSGFTTAA